MKKITILLIVLMLISINFLIGCNKQVIKQEEKDLIINYFTATPPTIKLGMTSVINWSVDGATSVDINGIDVAHNSSWIVVPTQYLQHYNLTASNENKTVNQTIIVLVYGAIPLNVTPPNITCNVDSNENKIIVGSIDSNIYWKDMDITLNKINTGWEVYNINETSIGLNQTTEPSFEENNTINVGDYLLLNSTIPDNNVIITFVHKPTRSLLGYWTINI